MDDVVKTLGKKLPCEKHGYLPVRSKMPLTTEQCNCLLEVVIDICEKALPAPNGLWVTVVHINMIREEFADLRRICKEQGLELLLPPATTPGVTAFQWDT